MKQYLDLLQNILDNGVEKESGRANMPNTFGLSFGNIQMDLSQGKFPLLTTKKMYWKGIVHELLWFLRGDTNIKYLVDNKVNIWNGDAYRWYLKFWGESDGKYSQEEFIEKIKEGNLNLYTKNGDWDNPIFNTYKLGDLGKVYGYQWRSQNEVDQLKDVIDGLRNNPYSRYHIIDGWNKADFPEMALPPCHLLYHFIVRPIQKDDPKAAMGQKFYLDLNMYQRSCDTLLGVPFNIASMSLLLRIIAKAVNMIPGISNWIGGDTHLYLDHIDQVKEQLTREPLELPYMLINKGVYSLEDIENLSIDDFELVDYNSHDSIKAELFTGLKK